MGVSNKTIINKMIQELNKAQINTENNTKITQHIEYVKLLCDLVLDEETPNTPSISSAPKQEETISAKEMKAMIGNKGSVNKPSVSTSSSTIDHDDANGDSILDF